MTSKVQEYRGGMTISLIPEKEGIDPFSFGPFKAQLIVDNFPAIKEFAEKHYTKKT